MAGASSPLFAARSAADRYAGVRAATLSLTQNLTAEDMQAQSMPDASPTKWHLAHTSWFFETFVLRAFAPGYRVFDERFAHLFNSYYEAEGDRWARPRRGLLSRPSLDTVLAWRRHVDAAMTDLLDTADAPPGRLADLLALGLAHEEQHQELILMDIKHLFSLNPLAPACRPAQPAAWRAPSPLRWLDHDGGLTRIGHDGDGFAFDNEGPRHTAFLHPFRIASRLATCGEWLAFMADGGYARPLLWLSDGWAQAQREGWDSPLYWRRARGGDADGPNGWRVFTLTGWRAVDPAEPVRHVSYYEADAFARWSGARLPTEAEWETAARDHFAPEPDGDGSRHEDGDKDEDGPIQLSGAAWQWTSSAYAAYPGFRPAQGAVGEYNGKFMSGQMTLRGGAGVTPPGHTRVTYRNFFPPAARWAFSGVRLADDR